MVEADRRVLAQSPAVDPAEFLLLLQPHLHTATRLAHGMLRNPTEAEDVVQEATLRAWAGIKTFRIGSDFRSWYLKIVANQCRQALRSRWWRVLRKPDVDRGSVEAAQDRFGANEEVRLALERLSYDHRAVIVLRYYLDLSFDEIGRTLGIPPQTARSRTRRALAQLRPILTVPEVAGDE